VREKYLTAKGVNTERRYNMGLFGDKEELEELKANLEELQQENESQREQIRVYERDRDNFRELKIVADRLTAENKALLSKIETFNSEKERIAQGLNAQKAAFEEDIQRLRGFIAEKEREISEISTQLTSKRDEIASKMFAISSKNTDISLPDGLSLSGGLKTERSIVVGNDVTVRGDIEAADTVTLGARSVVVGAIRAKNVISKEGCEFRGDVYASDKILLGDKATILKGLDCDGLIKFGNQIEMKEDFHTKGDIQTGTNCIFKRLHSDGEVVLGPGTKALYITAGANVELMDGVVVEEGIEYGGQMKIGKDVHIGGMIKARS
jgi:predicted acyltransferase (DUF342 family)